MSNDNHVLEVAIFKVKKEFVDKMPIIREELRDSLWNFSGLLDLNALSPIGEDRIFADIVKWDTVENAMIAAKAFESGDKQFFKFLNAIEDVKFMGHFKP